MSKSDNSSNNDNLSDRKRIDFKFRFQTYADTPEDVVMSYLRSKGSRSSKELVWQVLRMCFLPLAYKDDGSLSDERLRIMALEACNALENYISYIRQVFGLEKPNQPIIMMNDQLARQSQPEPEPEPKSKSNIRIKGIGTIEDMDAVFGDM